MMSSLYPFVWFYFGAVLVALSAERWRKGILLSIPVISGLALLGVDEGTIVQFQVMGYTLTPFRADSLSLLFGYLFHIAAFIAILFALHVRDTVQQVTSVAYAGSALGAVFAGDLITLFIFWELLAVTSVFLIWARRTEKATRSGMRYLIIQVGSGVLLLAGALLLVHQTGSLIFDKIGLDGSLASWLIFIAFGIKCAFPLAHNWLTDAYPEATPTGTIFLSAFTTKVAVYALARAYPGTEILVYVGATMAAFPIFYAVIENDLRRVLAYSMINQIGFMVCGVGIGTALALNGAVAHAFTDVIFKGLLMMTMGVVLQQTGRINGSELGGLYKTMPKTTILCIVGAASISAFPLFSGFVSKSMVMAALLEEGHTTVWLVMLFAAAGVFHHAGIKIPYFAFFAHDSGIRASDPPLNMMIAMVIGAVLCVGIGSNPSLFYSLLPYDTGYSPYDATHVLTQLQLLFFSAGAFVWLNLKGLYPPELPSTNLDMEWLYRRLIPASVRKVGSPLVTAYQRVSEMSVAAIKAPFNTLSLHHGPRGLLARTWPTGSMVLWVAILLGGYLIFYYI
uniref:Putative multisubunit Na+/H+ antiporter, MnhA subunit. NADH dehydrogenase (Quinone) n=1 Tax=Magnetococcus massalia (strain MO-1) TaxID=451514 RepID=A0A1S7LJ14_MAGMO|nr:Putative multisubunit Na+/H+ antiporter, MnhA subunit. NADH dehydrogenase (Quinone) [Candidatus Magnetococcus massalia]